MNDITNHIKKAADHVHLSAAEKREMTRVIHEYMAHKPLREDAYSTSIQWFSFAWIRQPIAAALALVFLFTGGISFAAEGALPGDALYTMKIKVNEPVRVAFASGAEEKAEIHMELAERRIEEATTLASENRLDIDTETTLAAAFEKYAESATDDVNTIDETDASAAAEITSRFETRLAAHEEVLELVRANADATNTLANAIRTRGLAVADIRARAEERISVSAQPVTATMSLAMESSPAEGAMMMKAAAPNPSTNESAPEDAVAADDAAIAYDSRAAKRMLTAAEAQFKNAQKRLKSSRAIAESKEHAEAELLLAQERIEEGRAFLADDANAQAYHAFQQSLLITEKLNIVLKSKTAFERFSERATNLRASARTKTSAENNEERAASFSEAGVKAAATATPIELEVEAEIGTTIHEVLPIIPPPLQIFRANNHDQDEKEWEGEWEKDDLINSRL